VISGAAGLGGQLAARGQREVRP